MHIAMISVNSYIPCDGFRLILALLRQEGHDVRVVLIPRLSADLCTDQELTELERITNETELVLVGVYSTYSGRAVQVTRRLKQQHPERTIIWGGPHCIASPKESLLYADGVCFCEGDEVVPEFVAHLARNDPTMFATRNMGFNTDDGPRINSILPLTESLDDLPFYDYSFEDEYVLDGCLQSQSSGLLKIYMPSYPFLVPTAGFLTTRGCPHKCTYCNNSRYVAMYGRVRIRKQSVERFMEEVEYTLSRMPFVDRVMFSDDDFLIRPIEQLEQFAERYRRTVGLPFAVAFSANTYRREKIEVLLDNKLTVMQIGVQSGSQRMLDEVYKRSVSVAKTRAVIEEISPLLVAHKALALSDFIVDCPYETEDDLMDTYHFIVDLPLNVWPSVFTMVFFPGTPLYDQAVKDGHIRFFETSSFRNFLSRDTRYQINYPMLLIWLYDLAHQWRINRKIPKWIWKALGSGPVRWIMRGIPKSVMRHLIRPFKLLFDYIIKHHSPKK